MYKKQVYAGIVGSLLLAFVLYFLMSSGLRYSGFATYDGSIPAQIICGANVIDSSALTVDFTTTGPVGACDNLNYPSNSDNGAILAAAGIILDCQGHQIQGYDGTLNIYGLKITADNVTIKRCDVYSFKNDLNISSNNVLAVDTIINLFDAGVTADKLFIGPSLNGTLLNTSFTNNKVQVGAGSNLFAKYYAVVNVTNSTGPVAGANVTIYNESGLATNVVGITNAQGLMYVNLTERVFTSGTGAFKEFNYLINATTATQNGTNVSFNPIAQYGTQIINVIIANAPDTTPPLVTIISPANQTYNNAQFGSGIGFNVSTNENASCNYSLDGGVTNISLNGNNGIYGTLFNATNTSMAEGSYMANFYCADIAGNRNNTESVGFNVHRTPPGVVITSPTGSYTTATAAINIGINEAGYCTYSINGGINNFTLTSNASNSGFTGTTASLSNGAYILSAYCNDSVGNRNDSISSTFTIAVSSGTTGGGGGDSGCTVTTTSYSEWSSCSTGLQTRQVITNCGTSTQTGNCSVCINQCSSAGNSCNGNSVETCALVDACYKITNTNDCGSSATCNNGVCVSNNIDNPVNTPIHFVINPFNRTIIYKPSSFIPHGDVPAPVVDTGVGIVVVGGISWILWLWLLAFLPFLSIKLRHYSVSAIDYSNKLGIMGAEINKDVLIRFVSLLEQEYGPLVYADSRDKVIKYVIDKGFVEISLDSPFIITGHFSRNRDANRFEDALRNILAKLGAKKINIYRTKETESIIGAYRAWRRLRKSRKEIRGLFKR